MALTAVSTTLAVVGVATTTCSALTSLITTTDIAMAMTILSLAASAPAIVAYSRTILAICLRASSKDKGCTIRGFLVECSPSRSIILLSCSEASHPLCCPLSRKPGHPRY